MSSDLMWRAANTLLAYRRGDEPKNLHARDQCRRLADALRGDDAVSPLSGGPAFLTLALQQAAARDPAVRELVGRLAALTDPSETARHDAGSVVQQVNVGGNGNQVMVSGRDTRIHGRPDRTDDGSSEARRRFTVLFASACPDELDHLRVDREFAAVQEAIEASRLAKRVPRMAAQARGFVRAISSLRPRVVHFAGHGSRGTGELIFEDELGGSFTAPVQGVSAVFAAMKGIVECVVLNACYSHGLAEAILPSVPYVVGTRGTLGDEEAITYASGFYTALGDGSAIPEAHALGVAMMRMARMDGEAPVLESAAG